MRFTNKNWEELKQIYVGEVEGSEDGRFAIVIPARRDTGYYMRPVSYDLYDAGQLVGKYPTRKAAVSKADELAGAVTA